MVTVDSATIFVPFFSWPPCQSPQSLLLLGLCLLLRVFYLLARSFAGGRHLSGGDIGLDAGFDNQCPGCSLGRIDGRGGGHVGERGTCLVIGAAATLLVSVAAAAALHVGANIGARDGIAFTNLTSVAASCMYAGC